ncbi:MAG: hypothetical protein RLY20_2713, partial [Verrucomicrobiota bacterium]
VVAISSSSDVHEFKLKPSEVNVTLQGEKTAMQTIERRMIHVQVDLSSAVLTNGTKFRVDVIPPTGITAVQVQPIEVEVIPPSQKKSDE